MTKQEKQAERVANKLLQALCGIEDYDGDPGDIISDAYILMTRRDSRRYKGALDALDTLQSHYEVAS